jgi:nitroimidazol reductase NimA-like FMN-containing flavoprotein (pyridoxamine 5'-phosphate oxidase superfamily)
MFREMRRNKQALPAQEAEEILRNGLSGVLAVSGDDGYPYAVPLSYAYADNQLFFHWANSGHKLDGIGQNEKVSFCVIGQDEIVPEAFATNYRSVIAFGRARVVTDDATKRRGLELLARKYSPGYEQEGAAEIEKDWKAVTVVEMTIEHLTGKEGLRLARQRQGGNSGE